MNGKNMLSQLKTDPIPTLLASHNPAVVYFVKRDLLGEQVEPINVIWKLPAPQKIVNKQQADGSWKYTGKKAAVYPPHHYSLVETFKQFRILVERYGFNKGNLSTRRAAEYLFSCQTAAGDIRGFIGNQYATYYTGAVLSLLIKAGYEDNARVEKGMQWLLSMRQADGGWTISVLTHKFDGATMYRLTSQYAEPVEPDRSRPFSHNWTDMVLRAFAAHPRYRHSQEAISAGALLKSRFFKPDVYSSYKAASYWVRFQFWWPNLLTAIESLLAIGFKKDDPDIKTALDWFIAHQTDDGLWNLSYDSLNKTVTAKSTEARQWLSLAICRILKNG
jgi:hypothetical protein